MAQETERCERISRVVGRDHNPSDWQWRAGVGSLSLTGFGIALYLALYQMDTVTRVWEPFFGSGSTVILKESAVSHLLPVPDAALGAVAYLIEAATECVGGRHRWRTRPAAVFATGAVAAGLGLAALALVACQVLWFRTYCTLCLASAVCSVAIFALVVPEVRAAFKHRRESGRRETAPDASRSLQPWR